MFEPETGSNIPYGIGYYAKPGDTYLKIADVRMHHLASIFTTNFKPQSSLDIGCAHGLLVYWLRRMGVQAFGVDVSSSAFSMTPKDNIAFLTKLDIESERLPFQDENMDLVSALEVIEHLSNLKYPLSEIRRVLRPGGYFFITTPLPFTDSKLGQFLIGRGWRMQDETHVNVHYRGYWKRLMMEHGFTYSGLLSIAFNGIPSEFWPIRILNRLPCGNIVRAYLVGASLFQKQ